MRQKVIFSLCFSIHTKKATFVKDRITQNNPEQSRTTQNNPKQPKTTQNNPKQLRTTQNNSEQPKNNPEQPRTAQRHGKNNMQAISTGLAVTELRPQRSIIFIFFLVRKVN